MKRRMVLTGFLVLLFVFQASMAAAPLRAGPAIDAQPAPGGVTLPPGVDVDWWRAVRAHIGQGDDPGAPYPAPSASLPTSPTWMGEGDQAGAEYGQSVSMVGDVNGDGYDEVIVGAPFYDNDQVNEGRVFVYYGSACGPSLTPDWMAESDQADAYLGISVDTAGDVNDDGYADVIVGATWYDGGQVNEGAAFVFHGSATGLPDADGDGLAHPSDANWMGQSDQAEAQFGHESSTAGDVNRDGYDEVMVAASLYDNNETDEGRVFVYYGSASGLSTTPDWMFESDLVGAHSFANGTAGDVNGDDYGDIIVGAHYSGADRAYVFYGSAAGLPDADADGLAHPGDADWTARSDQSNSRFGAAVSTAGNVNGDDYDDVIIGDNFYSHGQGTEGRAFVYYGSASGLPDANGDGVAYPTDAHWMAESDQGGAYFGRTVTTAGDLNGDGFDEVLISAFDYDGGQTNEGAAFIFYGSDSGLPASDSDGLVPLAHLSDAGWSAESDQAYASLWTSASPGDVNCDGLTDVVVGSWRYDNGQNNEGVAFVYYATGPNVAPSVGEITALPNPAPVNTEISASADFTDPDVCNTHTAVWDWGDDKTSVGTVNETNGSVTGSHAYETPGVYTVVLTVTDSQGASGQSVFQFIVVYDTEGGFVTGGGWIDSPEGAYTADLTFTGKANFDFVSKYKKGANVPTGNTEFQFKASDLNFHSDSYDWLVVAGQDKAKYKGVGTINGSGNYGFMLTATDGSPDTFRIKIWDKDAGEGVVYDNKMGVSDDSYDGTELSGGNIVIHKKK